MCVFFIICDYVRVFLKAVNEKFESMALSKDYVKEYINIVAKAYIKLQIGNN